ASGTQAWLREQGRGFQIREARVPIVPAAILFDLLSGGDKNWGRYPPYRELGYDAAKAAAPTHLPPTIRTPPLPPTPHRHHTRAPRGVYVLVVSRLTARRQHNDMKPPVLAGGSFLAGKKIWRPRLAGIAA